MKNISLKIDEAIFEETEKILLQIKKPRNRYINEAISYYNKVQRKAQLQELLKKESFAVRKKSMEVLKDFEQLQDED